MQVPPPGDPLANRRAEFSLPVRIAAELQFKQWKPGSSFWMLIPKDTKRSSVSTALSHAVPPNPQSWLRLAILTSTVDLLVQLAQQLLDVNARRHQQEQQRQYCAVPRSVHKHGRQQVAGAHVQRPQQATQGEEDGEVLGRQVGGAEEERAAGDGGPGGHEPGGVGEGVDKCGVKVRRCGQGWVACDEQEGATGDGGPGGHEFGGVGRGVETVWGCRKTQGIGQSECPAEFCCLSSLKRKRNPSPDVKDHVQVIA